MKPEQLLKKFKGDILRAAVAIGYTESAIRYWLKEGRIPPKAQIVIKARLAK